ncbi:MAG: TlpA disulfide reductase family protein [Enterobacterales bacterium]|nr:TlpA disulfide reductase family protein [Enterobacterales bacterium]
MKKSEIPSKSMKTITYYFSLVLFIALLILSACQPKTDFYLLDGQAKRLSDYQGSWLVVNFWAEWCAPCLAEIPELNKFNALAAQEDWQIIGISYDPLENDRIMELVKKWGIQYSVIASNPNPVLPFVLPTQLPGNYIINPRGELVAKLKGEQSLESLSKSLKNLRKIISNVLELWTGLGLSGETFASI